MIIRGSGLAAFALLALSTIWGLLLSSGFLSRFAKSKPLTYMHEGLAVGAIAATGVHLGGLAVDEYFEFGWRELFVPGASPFEPLWVSFGLLAFYAMVAVSGSFYARKRIGQMAWRYLHFSTFGIYAAAAAHGLMAGTDSANPYVFGGYVGSTAIILALTAVRIGLGGSKPKPVRARARTADAA